VRHGMRECRTVTQMDMPVVGTQQGNSVGHGVFQAAQNVRECYRKILQPASGLKTIGTIAWRGPVLGAVAVSYAARDETATDPRAAGNRGRDSPPIAVPCARSGRPAHR